MGSSNEKGETTVNKSEQQMWDAIRAHYEKYPEKWTVVKDDDIFTFMSA